MRRRSFQVSDGDQAAEEGFAIVRQHSSRQCSCQSSSRCATRRSSRRARGCRRPGARRDWVCVFLATTPASGKTDEPPEPAKQGANPLLIVGVLGGAVALLALLGIGVVVWSLSRPAKTPEEQVANAMQQEMQGALEQMAKDLQENPPSELNPQAIAEEMQKALQGKVPAGSAAHANAPDAASPDAVAKVLKSIPDSGWKDVTQLRGIELNKLKLSLASAWLAADEAGTRARSHGLRAKYVFVQVRVTNAAPVVRKYKSWNVAGGTSVVLADQANNVLSLVPATSTPRRQSAVHRGYSARAERDRYAGVRRAERKRREAPAGAGQVGVCGEREIPGRHALRLGDSAGSAVDGWGGAAATPTEEPIAAQSGRPARSRCAPPLVIEGAAPPMPDPNKPAAPAAAPPKKEDRPPTREELNKQFEELSKKEGQPEAKKGEAQK